MRLVALLKHWIQTDSEYPAGISTFADTVNGELADTVRKPGV